MKWSQQYSRHNAYVEGINTTFYQPISYHLGERADNQLAGTKKYHFPQASVTGLKTDYIHSTLFKFCEFKVLRTTQKEDHEPQPFKLGP